ncbi:DEAD/DEAH box helicase family protein [Streptomyces chartreusis]|uniref:DEAD/DEAH box helicase family protein n=1 Tax=Streptomyces chartreusis TaxID=1969 RepID=UPI0036A3A5ED
MSPPPRFEPRGQQDLAPSGQGERARANLAALELLRVLEQEQRPAAAEEQRVLARWSGWGALPLIFEPRPARAAYDDDGAHERAVNRWDALDGVREKVRALLSDSEWADARRNTLNAHYTDGDLVQAVWGAVRKLGFKGGQVLEPGSGSGNFIGLAPTLLRGVRMTGVEVERNTAAISRYLYPDAEIITSGLEEVPLADGGFDAVVGNVPYGRYKRFDKVHNSDLKLSIHDHFVLKSLYATRPGGIVALITSRYTLDAEDPEARERMYQLGDLVGAVRLPARAHQAAAGTGVVTDVLFLRRRAEGEEPGDDTWLTSRKQVLPGRDEELAVNAYFGAHPEYVLGDLQAKLGQFGPEVTVTDRGDTSPAAELEAAGAAIAVEAEAAGLTAVSTAGAQTQKVQQVVYGGTEGALGLDEAGNPTLVDGGRAVPLEVHPDQRDKLVQLIRLKGLTQSLYEAEAATAEPGETPELARLRAELRMAYRDYRKSNPPLSKPRQPFIFTPKEAKERAERDGLAAVPDAWKQRTAYAWIDDDPDASFLFGLEEWDDKTNTATEQQVLLSRVLEPRRLPTRAKTAEDAIALAMEWDGGRLDMRRVASLLGIDQEEAAAQCADAGLAFRDPEQSTDQGDVWEPRHRYLSGNVRTKLAEAVGRAQSDPSYTANVAALERVQPEDLAPSEIKAKIGAPWIPVDVYDDFLRHLGFDDAKVLHAGGTIWEVRGAKIGDLARTEWGTPARPTRVLFEALLRQTDSTIRVTWTDSEGKTYVDQDATDAAQEKARLIAETFEDWVWADKDRAERLAKTYNEQFNNLVLSDYSDLPLTLPGLISDWEMRPHQNAAIRRIVNEPTAMLAHVVGAGKTATMAAGAMELRRTGLAKKPAFVVPNHMLKQWSREFRELYPNARILAISASDLSKKRRGKFMARIAGGEWDAVVLTHEAFNRVPLRPETQRAYLDQEMQSLREQLDRAAEAGMDSRTVKQIENTLANAEANLQKQIESMSDEIGVFLEDTGIDYLFVDEAHEYKNLRTVSAIPGAAIEGSAKATKLHMVVSWLRDTTESDRVACFATGTWPANSVTEMYVLQRFLAPSMLNELNLHAFDNWAATFGEVVSQLEPDPKGNGYKYKARFSRFFNVPELLAGYRTFADVQLAEDLNLPTPPVREAEGQRGERVLIPPAPAQREFIKRLPHQPWVSKPGGVLKALGEGLRASLDLSLVDASDILRELGEQGSGGSKEYGSKLPYAAEKIYEIWQETKDTVYPVSKDDPSPQPLPGSLQLVFLDEGTPGSTAKHGSDLYADLREELVERGMPRESIRFVHEANTDRKKEKLFADCRSGRVSVLIGSTAKMGTGTNIQDRATALHHLSYPWRPADMAQRDGRIERRGNLNVPWVDGTADDVRILYYVTERTFDEFRLTTLARKARFIGQIQRRDFNLREIEDIGAEAINIGMLAALASGDPAILQLAEATAERARLQGLARSWDRQQDARGDQLKDLDDFLSKAATAVDGMRTALPQRRPTNGDAFVMTVEDATYRSRDDAANALGTSMVNLARDQSLRPGQRVPIGTLGGLDFHGEIAFDHAGRRQLRLRFGWGHVPPLGQRDDRAQWQASHVTQANGRGAIQSLETFLKRLDEDLDKLSKSLSAQNGNREKIAANLRDKDENPYRMHARSKEREERALGKLVVANEKESALAERVERVVGVNEEAEAELNEELATLREAIAGLRQIIADEHAVQDQARALARGEVRTDSETDTATLEEAATAAEDNETEAPAATGPADTSTPAPATGPPPAPGDTSAATTAAPDGATDTGDGQTAAQDQVPSQPAEAAAETAPEPPAPPSLTDPGVWEEAVQAYTDAALADPQIAQAAQANGVVDFTVAMASWFRGWVAEEWETVPLGERPAWVHAYQREGDDAVQARNSLHAEVAGPVYAQLRQPAQEEAPEKPAATATNAETSAPATTEEPAPAPGSAAPTGEENTGPVPAETEPETTGTESTEPEQHTAPSPAMARCAAVLRYYEPLLRRHKLSGKDVVAYIDRPGVGYSYDPDNPLLDLVHEIGKVGERVGGSFRRSYHEWVHYQVGERRQRQSEELTHLSIDLLTLHGGDTESLFTVDLEAILAAPPGTVIELEDEAEIEAAEAAAARIRIIHDAEGTEVRNTPRGGDQRIRDALNDMGFNWSRKQQKWYQPRDTPFEDREAAVQGLRAAFDGIGVAYTYEGPAPEAEPEEARDSPEESRTESPADTAAAAPDQPATDEQDPAQQQADDAPPADDTAEEDDSTEQLDLFGGGPATATSEGEPSGGQGDTGGDTPPAPEPEPETDTEAPETAAEDEQSDEETEAPAEGTTDEVAVQTPHGPGIVIGTDDNGLVLVTTAAGTRVYEDSDIQWPDDVAKPEGSPETAAKARQNEADAEQAATSEGIELRHTNGTRLVDLDVEAGHGTIVDTDGAVVGWVRARTGDDHRRYWWGQDSRGGTPTGPFHESLPVTAGVPAIRAAELARTTMPLATRPENPVPITDESAAREVRLTTAQVRELSELPLTGTYSDGSPIEPPEWVSSHRRYVLTVGQMQALGETAQKAADALPGATGAERRTIRVLRNAVERFDFEAYDTARSEASLPPIGEVDPYARPYQRPDRSEATPQQETGAGPAEQEAATEQTAAAEADQTAPAETSESQQAPATAAGPPTEEETQPQETTAAEPDTGTASQSDPAPQTDPAPAPEPAPADDGQLGLFPEETPDPAPTTPRRGQGRSRRGEGEPAAPPGTEGAQEHGHLGVYGHAGHGDCDRCGTPADRYTVVWNWLSSEETHGSMAAECAPCVELTVGISAAQASHLADVAEARRGGRRIQPRSIEPRNDVVSHRTADNEWTAVHLPSGKRYRLAKETESSYRGFVLRDLFGVSQGTGIATDAAYALAERAALGRTAETHPNASDDWVLHSYRSNANKIALHEGETLTSLNEGPRTSGPYEHGPRWELAIGEASYVVEMVYQPGQPGDDGHRLLITGPDEAQARYEHWDGVLEWAREHAREAAAAPAAPVMAAAAQAERDTKEAEPTQDTGEMDMPQETAESGAGVEPGDETAPTAEEATPGDEETVEAAVEIEDPPEPQSFTEVTVLPADEFYQLHLTGLDGQAPDRGELHHGNGVVATVQQSAGGQWFARLAVPGLTADVTNLADGPQQAADRGAILFSTLTGTPYGQPPTAAPGNGPLARAGVLRAEIRDAALWHRGALANPADRVWPLDALAQQPYIELTARLSSMAEASSANHNSRQMTVELRAVAQAATAWRDALPADSDSFERQMLAFPLAQLLHDVQRLQLRLQATVEAAQADQASARQQAAAEAAPPAPEPAPPIEGALTEQPGAPGEQDTPTPGSSAAAAEADPAPTSREVPAAQPPGADAEPPVAEDLASQASPGDTEATEEPGPDPAESTEASEPNSSEPADSTEPPAGATEGTEMATPVPPAQPENDDASTDIAVEGARRALAEAGFGGAQQTESGDSVSETAAEESGDEESDWASVYAWTEEDERKFAEAEEPPTDAEAEQAADLPLYWRDPEAWAEQAAAETPDEPLDVMAAFEGVAEAWGEIVPSEQSTEEELWQAVESDLRTLQQQLAEAVATVEPAPESDAQPVAAATAPEAEPTAEAAEADGAIDALSGEPHTVDPQGQAEAVNAALRQADTRADDLKNLPEWQELQTIRGAFANLGRVLKERAGEKFDQLRNDNRVGEFFRKISLKVCEKIAELAQKGADRLRGADQRGSGALRGLPSADALLRLGDAAAAYSSPRPGPGGAAAPTGSGPAGGQPDIPAMRKMGEALSRPLPTAANGGRNTARQGGGIVSTSAARGRSTTVKRRTKGPAEGPEQAGPLRHDGGEQQKNRKTK